MDLVVVVVPELSLAPELPAEKYFLLFPRETAAFAGVSLGIPRGENILPEMARKSNNHKTNPNPGPKQN